MGGVLTEGVVSTIALANQEAKRYNHEYIGTEHILLGLVRGQYGAAADILRRHDLTHSKVRDELDRLIKAGPEMVTLGRLPQTPRTKLVLEYAIEEARDLGHHVAGTEHLLLGLLREHDGIAAQVLRKLGLETDAVRGELRALAGTFGESGHPLAIPTPKPTSNVSVEAAQEPLRSGCELCARIDRLRRGELPAFIAELEETYAVLGDNQGLRGWCVLWLKGHQEHLADLDPDRQCRIFGDVARVAAAMRRVVAPRRINYECLGNVVPHIHWHVIPRHADDPEPTKPVWGWSEERLRGNLSDQDRADLIAAYRAALG